MRGQCFERVVLVLAMLTVALPITGLAQSGKLAGIITDAESGDAIPGATIILDGTSQGSVSDVQGQYVILNVDPGRYSVRVSFVGFTTRVFDGVLITSDRTTSLDVALSSEVVEAGEVVVEATRPVVDQNQTTSRALITSEEITLAAGRGSPIGHCAHVQFV